MWKENKMTKRDKKRRGILERLCEKSIQGSRFEVIIDQAINALCEIVEGMKKDMSEPCIFNDSYRYKNAYNQACDDIIKKMRE